MKHVVLAFLAFVIVKCARPHPSPSHHHPYHPLAARRESTCSPPHVHFWATRRCALVFYFYTNLLALVEALANAVLLLRAYMLFKAKGTEYATLKDDDTVVVDMPKSPSAAEALV